MIQVAGVKINTAVVHALVAPDELFNHRDRYICRYLRNQRNSISSPACVSDNISLGLV